jgi:hypothetical protein
MDIGGEPMAGGESRRPFCFLNHEQDIGQAADAIFREFESSCPV